MLIGVDIRRAGGFGVGTYVKNLVRSLARIGPENNYVLIGRPEHRDYFGKLGPNFGFVPYDRAWDSPRSHIEYGFFIRGLGLDVFHMPHRWVPLCTPGPYVATVHDLNYIFFPSEDNSAMRERLRLALLRNGLQRATRIITVSEATRRDAVKHLGLPAERISVVYDAVDDDLAQPVDEAERARTLARYSIDSPFVLYTGRMQPQKNVPRLIEAFAVAKAQLENHWKFHNLKLILIGDELSAFPSVRHSVMRSRIQSSVRFLGFVPTETLRVFYDAATAFLFPSLYEGFGLPPLEAMAHGTPVVTSSVSSLPESVGEAAVLVNPTNVFDIARGLRQVLLQDDQREELRRRGYEQVRRFSWDEAARRVLEIYRQAAQGGA